MIAAKHIHLKRNGSSILNGVSVTVKPGQFTAFAGPNGAGKSSLLKVISKEWESSRGDVEIHGVSIKKYSATELAKVRSVLSQDHPLQFPFSVKQVVGLGMMHNHSVVQFNCVMDEIMEITALAQLRDRNYLSLSGGEQQRVQLARVLAQVWDIRHYPRYILLDEPTSGLDIAQQQVIFNLTKMACARNIGVMAIVHDLNQAALYADRIYFLRDGELVANGNTRDVFTKGVIEKTFCCQGQIYHDPCNNCPYFITDAKTLINPLNQKIYEPN